MGGELSSEDKRRKEKKEKGWLVLLELLGLAGLSFTATATVTTGFVVEGVELTL